MLILAATALMLISGAPLEAQQRGPLAEAVNSVRRHGNAELALRVLSQARGPVAPDVIEALGDSLVAIAIAYDGEMPREDYTAALAAVTALGGWGAGHLGTPHPGAFDRLSRTVTEAQSANVAGAGLFALTIIAEKGRVVNFLADLAQSDAPMALSSVEKLAYRMGDLGDTRLRQLYRSGSVQQVDARALLISIARARGW